MEKPSAKQHQRPFGSETFVRASARSRFSSLPSRIDSSFCSFDDLLFIP